MFISKINNLKILNFFIVIGICITFLTFDCTNSAVVCPTWDNTVQSTNYCSQFVVSISCTFIKPSTTWNIFLTKCPSDFYTAILYFRFSFNFLLHKPCSDNNIFIKKRNYKICCRQSEAVRLLVHSFQWFIFIFIYRWGRCLLKQETLY